MKDAIFVMDDYITINIEEQFVVHISSDVVECLNRHRQLDNVSAEQFGVLMGSRSIKESEFWIEANTTPQANDKATRFGFLLRDKKHQKEVDKFFDSSDGILGYMGTWHTHPEALPTPSCVDINDWKRCVKRNSDRQLFFIIQGYDGLRIYINKKWKFVCVSELITNG